MAALGRFKIFGQYLGKQKESFTLSSRLAAGNFFHNSVNEKGESTVWRTDDGVMSLFECWIVEHKKVYNSLGENEKRFQTFKDKLRFIDEHSSNPNKTITLVGLCSLIGEYSGSSSFNNTLQGKKKIGSGST